MSSTDSFFAAWRARPIFISSTFRDMHAERDYLRSHVFPLLEDELRSRRHVLEPIDLRLGVESAQEGTEAARELLVLKVCLDEIVRSRPFMLVLLGDRYGWVPPEDRLAAAAREQGFDIDPAGKSVTALEIEFGILDKDPSQRQRTLFFFRRPLPCEDMPPDVAAVYSDSRSPDARVRRGHARLEALKQRIRRDPELGPRVFDYSVAWDARANRVAELEAFGELVHQQLWAALDQETAAFAARPAVTWQERERDALAEFVEHRRRDFVGRGALLDRLRAIAIGSGRPDAGRGACVTGRPGAGKSALFAELHHRLNEEGSVLVLANAAGATAHGSRVDAMLRRWIDELAARLGIAAAVPDEATPDDVEAVFYRVLRQASHATRVAVLVDGLDQFEATPRGAHLTWFRPAQWPENAALVATSLPCAAAEALADWAGIEEIEIPALAADDVAAVARATWRRYHRDVSPDVVRVLAEKTAPGGQPASGNPLWLTLALEQLNLLDADDFARADREFEGSGSERLRALVVETAQRLPGDVEGLYGWLLAQNEKVFGAAGARAFAVAIALSQRGWREADLVGIITRLAGLLTPGAESPAVDDLQLAALRRGFRAHVVRRGELGQLDFGHAQTRAAVEAAYLGDEALRRQAHARVSDYLESLDLNDPIVLAERMWQLIGERDTARAAAYYATLRPSLAAPGEERVGPAWTLVNSILGTKQRWTAQADSPDDGVLEWVLAWFRNSTLGPARLHQLCHNVLGGVLGRLAGSAPVDLRLRLAEAVRGALAGIAAADSENAAVFADLAASEYKVGDLLAAQGDLAGALGAYSRSLGIAGLLTVADPADTDWQGLLFQSYERIGDAQRASGDLTRALEAYRRALMIADRSAAAHPDSPAAQSSLSMSHNRVAYVLVAQGDLAGALDASRRALAISERLAAADPQNSEVQDDLALSHERIGDVLVWQGNRQGALDAFGRSLAIRERLAAADPSNAKRQRALSASHERAGDMLLSQGNQSRALDAYRRSLAIGERLAAADPADSDRQRNLSISHNKVGHALFAKRSLAEAQDAFLRALAIRERLAAADPSNAEWQRDLSMSRMNIADVLVARGDRAGALEEYRRVLAASERLAAADPGNAEWHRDVSLGHVRVGNLLLPEGDLPGALEEYRRMLAITERLAAADPGNTEYQHDLSVGYEHAGEVLRLQGDVAGALEEYERALVIARRLGATDPENAEWRRGLSSILRELGDTLVLRGDPAEAFGAYEEALGIATGLAEAQPGNRGLQQFLSATHIRIASSLAVRGDLEGAFEAAGHALEITKHLAEANPTDAACQGDLSRGYLYVADILATQGNLAEAFDAYQRSMAIASRLVAEDPGAAACHRDLAAAHYGLAQLAGMRGDDALAQAELRQCWDVLVEMRGRGLPFDPTLRGVYERLARTFEGPELPGSRAPLERVIDIPQPHPRADPEAAARLNMDYQRRLAEWKALPWWRKARTPRPDPPTGI